MDFLRQHINNNDENNIGNIPSPENNNYINNKDNGNCCDKENMDKKKPKKKQIAEFTNIRDIPLHRVQFVDCKGGDSVFLLKISIVFAIGTIVAYIVLSYTSDMTIKEYDSRWRKLFIIAFESYTNGGSFIFIIWGVAFLFVSHVINQREDADALRNEFNIDGNQVLFIRASIPDFYNFKKELTRGCNIKLVKNPFLFNTESTRNLYSDKVEDYIQYDSKTCICQSQFHTDKFYQYQYQPDKIPSNNNSNTSLNSMNSENIKLKSINSIQKAINNSSKLEKILIATPINLSD